MARSAPAGLGARSEGPDPFALSAPGHTRVP
jgi:hypothetical protein